MQIVFSPGKQLEYSFCLNEVVYDDIYLGIMMVLWEAKSRLTTGFEVVVLALYGRPLLGDSWSRMNERLRSIFFQAWSQASQLHLLLFQSAGETLRLSITLKRRWVGSIPWFWETSSQTPQMFHIYSECLPSSIWNSFLRLWLPVIVSSDPPREEQRSTWKVASSLWEIVISLCWGCWRVLQVWSAGILYTGQLSMVMRRSGPDTWIEAEASFLGPPKLPLASFWESVTPDCVKSRQKETFYTDLSSLKITVNNNQLFRLLSISK